MKDKLWIIAVICGLAALACMGIWGCVPSKSYREGEQDMAERVLHDLNTPMTKEEVAFQLKGYLDLEDLKK